MTLSLILPAVGSFLGLVALCLWLLAIGGSHGGKAR
jgi:hypothetical protein